MSESNREHLRGIFDEAAELYDQARPGYPAELFRDLAELADVGPGHRVLEIGCGTGKATVNLARFGCDLTAVELGPTLATVAQRNLADFPLATVMISPFETWPLPVAPFDTVISATAFHWLDPEVRVHKCADALKSGGSLAIISTHHVAGGTSEFFAKAQECYQRWMPNTPKDFRQPTAAEIAFDSSEIDSSGRFGPATFRRYEWELSYSAEEYLDVLRTYSNHRALPPADRAGLFDCLRHLIDSRHNGRIAKRYLTELLVARKR